MNNHAAEFLRSSARREACRIVRHGWRPSKQDLAQLKTSKGDAIAYRTLLRAWRAAGFPVKTIRKLAGRGP
jgi:hypothetical protein